MVLRRYPNDRGPEQPVAAHLIVMARREHGRGEVRTCACGAEWTMGTHPRGWWGTRWGRPPLQRPYVTCGLDIVDEQAA
jgi:hypothetical protein